MILRHVPVAEIEQHWPRVERGLQRICAKHTPDWKPWDLLRTMMQGASHLYMVGDDGFMIIEKYAGADGRGQMFIVACEGRNMMQNYEQAFHEVCDLARASGCKRIRHISPRKGWGSRFWKPVGYVYEHEV